MIKGFPVYQINIKVCFPVNGHMYVAQCISRNHSLKNSQFELKCFGKINGKLQQQEVFFCAPH